MSKKIKLLVSPSDTLGVGHFRSIWPAQTIQRLYSDEFDLDINGLVSIKDIEYLKKFDIIHFHRNLGPYEEFNNLSKILKENGTILIMDIDDWWYPPSTHPMYEMVLRDKLAEKIENGLLHSDYATTTTSLFAKKIKLINPNVEVLPNALDLNSKMWNSENTKKSDKVRIAWIGGSSHYNDLLQLKESMAMLYKAEDLRGKFQVVLCGFDTRGTITTLMPDNTSIVRKTSPQESIWNNFERILTNDYLGIDDKNYVKWLQSIKREKYLNEYDQSYVRRWTLPMTQYAKHYDFADICLAPLAETEDKKINNVNVKVLNTFNYVKSEVKIIEAGIKNKTLIAQDFGIYNQLLSEDMGILVNNNKNGWYKAIRKLILEKDLRQQMAQNLHNYVIKNYSLEYITKKRVDFYKRILKK